jgi:hypothetical protein
MRLGGALAGCPHCLDSQAMRVSEGARRYVHPRGTLGLGRDFLENTRGRRGERVDDKPIFE